MITHRTVLSFAMILGAAFAAPHADRSVATQTDTAHEIAGTWEGKLQLPGLEVRLALRITPSDDGGLSAVVLRPDHGDQEIPADRVQWRDGRLDLGVSAVGATFSGKLRGSPAALEGTWQQGSASLPLTLRRVAQVSVAPRPQTPAPPYSYDTEDVTYPSLDPGVTLGATVSLPSGPGPHPAVILVSGVGGHTRDYVVLAHQRFLVLADHLTRHGIAVLRFDDRGVAASSGDRSQATSMDFASDVLGGVAYLRTRAEIHPGRVGLIGHSEGGTIAALAAARLGEVAFIVMMGTPGLPGIEYNLQYEASVWKAMGLDEATIAAKRAQQERILRIVADASDPDAARAELRNLLAQLEPPLPEERIDAALQRFLSPWFRFSIRHDPIATLREVRCPVLALFGGLDVQVPPERNREAIEAALHATNRPHSQTLTLPGLNHFFQSAVTGAPSEYATIEETLAPRAMDVVTDWILTVTED